ncbi:MAG TPA: BatA domain-containing protein, partial [Vicinamibacterales bacterium]|nr:BatA domain-containing protein [Vicinamibacterales bacterium]
MLFASPHALWLLFLLPVPLLLSRRPHARRHSVSNLYLWRTSTDPDALSLTPRSLRRRWLVLVQMATLAAIAIALARPMVSARAERVAFVFDLSSSMSARDGGATRLDAARRRARSFLASLSGRSRVRLIGAGAIARDLGDYAAVDPALGRAIDQLTPTAGIADMSSAALLAIRSADERIVVFSDQVRDLGASTRAEGVAWEIVGEPADNLAISTLVARRRPLAPVDGDVLVVVHNYGSHPRRADVEISADDRVIGRQTIAIQADADGRILVNASDIGRVIKARLLVEDALAVDNQRTDVVPPVEPIRVRVAGRSNFYVDKALASDATITRQPSQDADELIVCGCEEPPPTGDVLLLRAGARRFDAAPLVVANPDHPIASALFFADTIASLAAGPENGDVIVRAGGVPAVVASERGGRRIVDIRFEPGPETAVNSAFPILIANAIRWLDGRGGNSTQLT